MKELDGTLDLTTVTVRHHLDMLRREELAAASTICHRKAPGRPQHIYTLTEETADLFSKRCEPLIDLLREKVRAQLSPRDVEETMVRFATQGNRI